jgi:predicted DNA-binding protein
MYDLYIVKRTQIYLDEGQATRLVIRARARGTTVSTLIREAVEEYLADPEDPLTELSRRRQALIEAFGSVPRLPDGAAYVDEVRRADAERKREIEDRWQPG